MSIMMYMLRHMKSAYSPKPSIELLSRFNSSEEKPMSDRMKEFKQKLRSTTPIQDLGVQMPTTQNKEEEPLESWPGGVNPHTGEVNGPKGPEPTRYGDWERKGRCVDF